jgi:hypothetical protein
MVENSLADLGWLKSGGGRRGRKRSRRRRKNEVHPFSGHNFSVPHKIKI